jgi:hypothetical protein
VLNKTPTNIAAAARNKAASLMAPSHQQEFICE